MLKETETSGRVQVATTPSIVDCYGGAWGNNYAGQITGITVSVTLDGKEVWSKRELTRYPTELLLYAPKPFFARRVRMARKKAEKIAGSLSKSF